MDKPLYKGDPKKEATNLAKQGIDFVDASRVFDDPYVLEEDSTRPGDNEARLKGVGARFTPWCSPIGRIGGGSYRPGGLEQMNNGNTLKVVRLADGRFFQELDDRSRKQLFSKSDWAQADAMTEEEIEANSLSDPDNPPSWTKSYHA